MLLTLVIIFASTAGAVAILVWAHWPNRRTFIPDHAPGDELEQAIEEVGNVDRKRVPGESGISGGSTGASFSE